MKLEIKNLTKAFGGVRAIDDVSLAFPSGSLSAVIGPNGAGKSTCFNMLSGQIVPDRGSIRIDGIATAGLPPRKIWRLAVGRTFQITATFASMTARENVQMALLSHRRGLSRLWGYAGATLMAEADALLDLVGMGFAATRAAAELAYGDLKRLELAVALANAPKLLLMDEPTAGMAPKERIDLMHLVATIAREKSIGVLFTEHDMDVVFEHADRVMVLNRGSLIATGDPQSVRRDPQVQAIYLGEGLVYDARHQGGAA